MKKILVIDDEELIVKSLSKLLERNGFEVFVTKAGQDALIMVEDEEFDLIISDVRMPGINGVEVVKSIFEELKKQNKVNPPVIFITGYADKDCEKEAQQLRPSAYIYKPFDISDLVGKVKEVLK
jgi:CheY-like chemotaxis protein